MIFIYNWDMEILFSRILCDIYSPECCKPDRFSEGTRFDTLRRIELKKKKKEKILSFTRTQLWLDAEKAGHVLSVF